MPSMIRKIEPGDVIGRCRIIRELGRGGVGTVYLATHQTLQIEVALKVLSPALSLDNPALAERFIREAQLAARIRHPNVIAVMDAAHDETTGLYFIVQEYVGGGSLSWHLRNGPLTERKSLEIITGIAQALIIAEENHIVHRDIKPDNIMLDSRGTPKLADLGLAKHDIDSRTSLTLGGSFMGTPAYMSPEQARDAKVADTRDDIYSLGATFYECLTGQPPFSGETPYNIMSELLTKPSPKPRAQRPELSRSVDLVCQKMMAKTRALRYPDARTLVGDLHHCSVVSDSGIDGLVAVTFEKDSLLARQEALELGVQPSGDGAGAPLQKPPGRTRRQADAPRAPDYSALRAAVLLVVLVTAATLLFAWMSPQHLWTNVKEQVSVLQSDFVAPTEHPHKKPIAVLVAPPRIQPAETESTPHSAPPEVAPFDAAPVPTALPAGTNLFSTSPTPPVASGPTNVILPPVPGTIPALPVNTNVVAQPAVSNGVAIPAAPATSDSALAARDVAEKSLPNRLLGTNGHAQLLHIHGKHSDDQPTPTLWIFDFFDPKAAGHSLIRTVANHQVVDNGQRLTDIISPYTPANILPDDIIDSSQALQIAAQLVPTIPVSGSEFELKQDKNSAAFWTVTLWAKNPQGEDVELGAVVILAEKGDVISNRLKPDRLSD